MSYSFVLDNNDDFYYVEKARKRSVLRFPKKLGFMESYEEALSDDLSVFKSDLVSYSSDINMSTYTFAKCLHISIGLNGNAGYAYYDKITKETKEQCQNHIIIDYINEAERDYFFKYNSQISDIEIVIGDETFKKKLLPCFNDEQREELINNYNKNITTILRSSLANPRTLFLAKEIYNSPFDGGLNNLNLQSKVYEIIYNEFYRLINKNDKPFLNSNSNSKIKLSKEDVKALHNIRAFILENKKKVTINELAKKAAMNRDKLKYGFKQLFNTTPGALGLEIRMDEAKRLLEKRELTITEISDTIGYRYVQSFTTTFKKYFGITPSEYVKNRKVFPLQG